MYLRAANFQLLLGAGTSADMYRTVFELLVSVKLFLGRFDMRTMQVSTFCPCMYGMANLFLAGASVSQALCLSCVVYLCRSKQEKEGSGVVEAHCTEIR